MPADSKRLRSPGLKNNKWKTVLLILYFLMVFVAPLHLLTPHGHNSLLSIIESMVPAKEDAELKQYIGFLREGDVDAAYEYIAEDAKKSISRDLASSMSQNLASTTDQIEIVGGSVNSTTINGNTTSKYDVTYQVANTETEYPYVLVRILAQDDGNGIEIYRTDANFIKQSVKDRTSFDLKTHWLNMLLSLLIPAFVLYTAYRYITREPHPGWIMFLVILLGTLTITMNGTTTGVNFGFKGFMSPSGAWGPILFLTPIPIGAMLYWLIQAKRKFKPQS